MSNFDDVGVFHRKFGLPYSPPKDSIADDIRKQPKWISKDVQKFRIEFLKEELEELECAYKKEELEEVADALIDIVYVAMGTAHMHNLPWDELWNEVQRSNLAKERATSAKDSKRASMFDVIKPKNWTPPRLGPILNVFGWVTKW